MAQVRLGRFEAEEGELPPLCLRCGVSATGFRTGRPSWCPGWILLLLLVTFVPYLLVSFLVRRKVNVLTPFCDTHRQYWLRQRLLTLGGFFALLVLLVVCGSLILDREASGANPGPPNLLLLLWILGLVWLVAILIRRLNTICVTELTEDTLVLNGVAPIFVERLRAEREGRVPGTSAAKLARKQPAGSPAPNAAAARSKRTR